MKTPITFLMIVAGCLLSFLTLNAAVLTVSNWSVIPAQYTSVQDAIEAAVANDVIYVHGSPTNYGEITIRKKLTIIGAGIQPNGKNKNRSTFSTIYLAPNYAGVVDNSNLIGLSPTTIYFGEYSNSNLVNGIIIDRCFIGSISTYYVNIEGENSFLIKNSIINGQLNLGNVGDVTITNNYFIGSGSIEGINSPALNAIISQNAFINGFAGAYYSPVTNCGEQSGNVIGTLTNAIFTNNIFYGSPITPTLTNTEFNNNLTFATNNNALSFPGAITTGTLTNVNPNFLVIQNPLSADCSFYNNIGVSLSLPDAYFNSINLTLAPGSPAINSGAGGVNVGPSGGGLSFDYRTQNRPRIPQMQSLIINNAAIQQGGVLNVQIQGQKQD